MSMNLALVLIDHDNLVVRGLPVVNDTLCTGDAAPLRRFLLTLPFEESPEILEHYRERLQRLRDVNAPPMIIETQERMLATLRPPTAESLAGMTLDELRLLLGRWSAEARTVDLGATWDLIHWYGDAGRRQRPWGDWRYPPRPHTPTALDLALYGSDAYPVDSSGTPVLRTGGLPDSSYYNPPTIAAQVHAALREIRTASWEQLDQGIDQLPEENRPYAWDGERLEYARSDFERLKKVYTDAAERGFGVSCEFY